MKNNINLVDFLNERNKGISLNQFNNNNINFNYTNNIENIIENSFLQNVNLYIIIYYSI